MELQIWPPNITAQIFLIEIEIESFNLRLGRSQWAL